MSDTPGTVLVAISHCGFRLDLTRKLLMRGVYASLMSDGECAARLIGRRHGLTNAPVGLVVHCRSAWGVRRLLRRIARLGWDASRLVLLSPPDDVRRDVLRAGARIAEDDASSAEICEMLEVAA